MPPLPRGGTPSRRAQLDRPPLATLRVISWNLAHWMRKPPVRAAAWRHLAESLAQSCSWDVALLQECRPPEDWPHPILWLPLGRLDWGTAVTVRRDDPAAVDGLRAIALEDDSHPGAVVAARIALPPRPDGTESERPVSSPSTAPRNPASTSTVIRETCRRR